MESNTKHIDMYDWLRFIATILVVIGHSAYLATELELGGVTYELPQQLNSAYNSGFLSFFRQLPEWIYEFHMPLFFMLSGVVLAIKPMERFDKLCASKIKRLILPYFIYGCLFMIPIKYLGGFYDNSNMALVFAGYFSGIDSGHLWFLPALFWCMIVFTILFKIMKKLNINSIYGLLFITGVIQLTHVYLDFDFFFLQLGLNYIFYFALGYVFESERRNREPWNIKKVLIGLIILVFLEIMHFNYGILNPFFAVICGAFSTYLLANLCSKLFIRITNTKAWKILVRNLFNVYLFHDPLEYIILKVFMDNNYLTSAFGCYMYTTLRTIGVFIVSIILGELVRYIKNIFVKILDNKSNKSK